MPVIDSSVFAGVIVKDEFYDDCRKYMLSRKATLDLAFAEAGNVLWKHIKMGRIAAEEAADRADLLRKLINTSKVFRAEDCLVESVKLAVDYGVTVYDAFFIVLAMKLNDRLVTTDRKLYDKVKGTELERFVECIGYG